MAFTSLIEQIKGIILEDSRLDVLINKFTKVKKKQSGKTVKAKLKPIELMQIVETDPTSVVDGDTSEVKKTGKYVQWLIARLLSLNSTCDSEFEYGTPDWENCAQQKRELFFEDLYKVTDYLIKFDKLKTMGIYKGEKDINKFKTIDDLFMAIKDYNLNTAEMSTTKEERREMEIHPGAELGFEGDRWKVIKITDNSLGKEAACFYGGNQKETNWCTSGPGLNYYQGYINRGPLYVVLDKSDTSVAEPQFGGYGRSDDKDKDHKQTGLPKNRYQFHFQDNMFMDINDRSIDVVEAMNGDMAELKPYFQPMFLESMGNSGDRDNPKHIMIKFGADKFSKYLAMYGNEQVFKNLPNDITRFYFEAELKDNYILNVPEDLYDKTDLDILFMEGCLDYLSPKVGNLKNLRVLSISENPKLKELPETICGLEKLTVLSVINTGAKVPQCILDRDADPTDKFYLVQ
jgi:hypothetical protein